MHEFKILFCLFQLFLGWLSNTLLHSPNLLLFGIHKFQTFLSELKDCWHLGTAQSKTLISVYEWLDEFADFEALTGQQNRTLLAVMKFLCLFVLCLVGSCLLRMVHAPDTGIHRLAILFVALPGAPHAQLVRLLSVIPLGGWVEPDVGIGSLQLLSWCNWCMGPRSCLQEYVSLACGRFTKDGGWKADLSGSAAGQFVSVGWQLGGQVFKFHITIVILKCLTMVFTVNNIDFSWLACQMEIITPQYKIIRWRLRRLPNCTSSH